MLQARFMLHVWLAIGTATFVIGCGQSTPLASSPPVGARQASPLATTGPYTVALACEHQWVGEYAPDRANLSRTFKYDTFDEITSVAYDRGGNLYIAVNTQLNSFVDEYSPGTGDIPTRHIVTDIHHPISMAFDPDGDLYVGNHGVLGHSVVMYKPGSTSADLTISDISYPSDLLFAKGHLYVADYDARQVRVYHIYPNENKAVLAWIISRDLDGPSELSYNMHGYVWVLNVPFAGKDFVREYLIATDHEPVYIRDIKARLNSIGAIATNPSNEDVYVGEWPFVGHNYVVSIFDRDAIFRYEVDAGVNKPASIVSSPTRYYVANHGTVSSYTGKYFSWILDLPGGCDRPHKLAMMQP